MSANSCEKQPKDNGRRDEEQYQHQKANEDILIPNMEISQPADDSTLIETSTVSNACNSNEQATQEMKTQTKFGDGVDASRWMIAPVQPDSSPETDQVDVDGVSIGQRLMDSMFTAPNNGSTLWAATTDLTALRWWKRAAGWIPAPHMEFEMLPMDENGLLPLDANGFPIGCGRSCDIEHSIKDETLNSLKEEVSEERSSLDNENEEEPEPIKVDLLELRPDNEAAERHLAPISSTESGPIQVVGACAAAGAILGGVVVGSPVVGFAAGAALAAGALRASQRNERVASARKAITDFASGLPSSRTATEAQTAAANKAGEVVNAIIVAVGASSKSAQHLEANVPRNQSVELDLQVES